MGSRLLPLTLVLAALLADTAGLHGLGLYVGLFAVPCAAAAAFVSASDALEGRPARLRAITSGLALALVVLSSAVRENAADGAPVPPLVAYALAAAAIAYVVPAVAWVLEPLRVRRRPRPRARRARPAPVQFTPTP